MKLIGLLLNLLLLGLLSFSIDKSLVFSLLFFYAIILTLAIVVSSRGEFSSSILLLSIVLPLYLLYSYFIYNDDFGIASLYYSDEGYFFKNITSLSMENSIYNIWKKTIVNRIHRDYEGFFLYHGVIGYLGKTMFDSSSIALHSFWASFLGVLSNLFIFKILREFFSVEKSLKLAFIFAFLSPLFYYSPWILRDVHITFLYAISFSLVLRKFGVMNVVKLFILSIVTMEVRVENGLFLLIFPFLSLLINKNKQAGIKKFFPVILVFAILAISFMISIKFDDFTRSADSLNSYSEYTEATMNQGFGSKLYELPIGIRQIAVVINSQLTPMPPWVLVTWDSFFIAGVINFFTTVFWGVLLFYGFFNISKKELINLPINLKYLYALAVVFLLLNTFNMTIRRVISIYPILFLFNIYLGSRIPLGLRKSKLIKSLMVYSGLIMTYFVFKAVLV